MILKRINVLSAAKISAAMGIVGGLLAGIMMAVPSLMFGSLMNAEVDGLDGLALGMGIGAIIFMPILYAIVGFVGGAVYAFVYNIASKVIGGIEVELVNVAPAQPKAVPQPPTTQE